MLADTAHFITFWLTPWSAPFRAACLWFTPDTQPLQGRKPNKVAPWWVRPFFVQQWVGEAIAARLAADPDTCAYRFGRESEPVWKASAWARYPRAILRQLREETLLGIWGMEVERLLRIAQESPLVVGNGAWTQAALVACAHLARVYAELRRRHRAMQAKAIVREELRRFVTWNEGAAALQSAGD